MEIHDPISSILAHKSGPEIWSVTPDSMVFDAIELMSDRNIGAVLVMEDETLVGILSERDYTRKVMLKGKASKETPVREIMTSPVIGVGPASRVAQCLQLMSERRIRHLPVLEEGRVIGVVSVGDLVNRMISAQGAMIDHLENYIVGSYPA